MRAARSGADRGRDGLRRRRRRRRHKIAVPRRGRRRPSSPARSAPCRRAPTPDEATEPIVARRSGAPSTRPVRPTADLAAVGVGVPGGSTRDRRRDPRGQPRLARPPARPPASRPSSASRASSRTTSAPRPSACIDAESSAAIDDLAYLAVGTGISAGVVLDGRLHRGARGLAGEIGHVIVDPTAPICACGQRGCLETFASGPAIARRAARGHRGRRARRSCDGRSEPLTADGRLRGRRAPATPLACAIVDDVGRRARLGRSTCSS